MKTKNLIYGKYKKKDDNLLLISSFIILIMVAIYPIFAFRIPALVDYPNHLASFYIQSHYNEDVFLQKNYLVKWGLKPYLTIEYFGGMLTGWFDAYTAGKILLALGLVVNIAGSLMLRKVIHGRVDFWMLILFVFLYNHILFWGFINYYITSGLVLIAFSAWIKYRESGLVINMVSFSAITLFLFFSHLFALGVYGVLVLGYEFGIFLNKTPKYRWYNLSKLISQFMIPAVLFFLWAASRTVSGAHLYIDYRNIKSKLMSMLSPLGFEYSSNELYLIVLFLISYVVFRFFNKGGLGIYKNMRAPLVLLFIVYLLMPSNLMGVWSVDIRIPYVLMLVLLASTSLNIIDAKIKLFVGLAIVFFGFKTYFITQTWKSTDKQFSEFRDAMQFIDPGAKVLTIQYYSNNKNSQSFVYYHHLSALAVIERSVFWPNLFTADLTPINPSSRTEYINSNISKQLTIRDLYENKLPMGHQFTNNYKVYWANWEQDFDYVISIRFENNPISDKKELKLIKSGSFFDIYKIIS